MGVVWGKLTDSSPNCTKEAGGQSLRGGLGPSHEVQSQTRPNVGHSRQSRTQKRQNEEAESCQQGGLDNQLVGSEWKWAWIGTVLQE